MGQKYPHLSLKYFQIYLILYFLTQEWSFVSAQVETLFLSKLSEPPANAKGYY